eukprot:g9132.t1
MSVHLTPEDVELLNVIMDEPEECYANTSEAEKISEDKRWKPRNSAMDVLYDIGQEAAFSHAWKYILDKAKITAIEAQYHSYLTAASRVFLRHLRLATGHFATEEEYQTLLEEKQTMEDDYIERLTSMSVKSKLQEELIAQLRSSLKKTLIELEECNIKCSENCKTEEVQGNCYNGTQSWFDRAMNIVGKCVYYLSKMFVFVNLANIKYLIFFLVTSVLSGNYVAIFIVILIVWYIMEWFFAWVKWYQRLRYTVKKIASCFMWFLDLILKLCGYEVVQQQGANQGTQTQNTPSSSNTPQQSQEASTSSLHVEASTVAPTVAQTVVETSTDIDSRFEQMMNRLTDQIEQQDRVIMGLTETMDGAIARLNAGVVTSTNTGPQIQEGTMEQVDAIRKVRQPTVQDVMKTLPKDNEDICAYITRLSKMVARVPQVCMMDIIRHIYDLCNPELQRCFISISWDDEEALDIVLKMAQKYMRLTNQNGFKPVKKTNIPPVQPSNIQRVQFPNRPRRNAKNLGYKCTLCNKHGHSERSCPTHKPHTVNNPLPKVHNTLAIDEGSSSMGQERLALYHVFGHLSDNPNKVSLLIDTGATCNVLPKKTVEKHGWACVECENTTLVSFNKTTSKPLGKIELPCKIGNVTRNVVFYVVDAVEKPILGMDAMRDFSFTIDCSNDTIKDVNGQLLFVHEISTEGSSKN